MTRADGDACLTLAALPTLLDDLHRWLDEHRAHIDDLNVFPVPDGDTGTNLLATVRSALDAVRGEPGREPEASAAANGALRGARGNSGVILAQLLSVLADALATGPVGPERLGEVLAEAVERSYEAVADPVEGTMLTVLRVVADRARSLDDRSTMAEATGGVLEAAGAAVGRTPDQLEVLRQAGVVDAGARGLEVTLAALDEHVTGRPPVLSELGRHGAVGARREEHAGPGFEVRYVLEPTDPAAVATSLRGLLAQLGDSVVVATSRDLVTVHVHTDEVAAAVDAGRTHGAPTDIAVTALTGARRCPVHEHADDAPAALGVVALVPGPGLAALAARCGATALQPGRGGPDVGAIRDTVAQLRARAVVILPGCPESVAAAEEVAATAGGAGRVVAVVGAADSAPAVLAALAVVDPSLPVGRALRELGDVAAGVVAGEVRVAARGERRASGAPPDAAYTGLLAGEAVVVAEDPGSALEGVVARAPAACELVTVITGRDVPPVERDDLESRVRGALPDAEVVVIDGGQTTARYLLGFE